MKENAIHMINLLQKKIPELQKAINNSDIETAKNINNIFLAIKEKNVENILINIKYNNYYEIYEKYKNLSINQIKEKLIDVNNLILIDILILIHLIWSLNNKTKIVWQKKHEIDVKYKDNKFNKEDINFLIEQFNKLTDEKIIELPTRYIERVRYLPKHLTPKHGFFEFDYTPYLREIFNRFSDDDITEEIAIMKSAQIGYTVGILENGVIYHIDCNAKTVQFITADLNLAKETVKTRIDPAIDYAGLRDKIFAQSKKRASKSTGDTTLLKEYYGGFCSFGGAKNPDAFRGRTYQVTLTDEIDTFRDDAKEGDLLALIKNRSNAWAETRKIFYGSTPLRTQDSKIFELYRNGDQRNYFVPCIKCGELQVLRWHGQNEKGEKYGIVFELKDDFSPDYNTVGYKCEHCGHIMKNEDKIFILQDEAMGGKAKWIATAVPRRKRLKSYWINALYSPVGMYSWENLVQDWSECWDLRRDKVKNFDKFKEFYNTKRGLPVEERAESISYERAIIHRRSIYLRNQIPNTHIIKECGSELLLLICSVDVQQDGLYVDIKGYTDGGRIWTIDFRFIDGQPTNINDKCWSELANILENETWIADDGKQYKIMNTFIDSGHEAKNVYAFCRYYPGGWVYPCKGDEKLTNQITFRQFNKETLQKEGLSSAFHINTYKLKDAISNFLNRLVWETGNIQPEFYPNFPDDLKDDYFKMFEAEQKMKIVDKITNRFKKWIWRQTSAGNDNHAFDTFVYNLAALEQFATDVCIDYICLDYLRWDKFWDYAKKGYFYGSKKNE